MNIECSLAYRILKLGLDMYVFRNTRRPLTPITAFEAPPPFSCIGLSRSQLYVLNSTLLSQDEGSDRKGQMSGHGGWQSASWAGAFNLCLHHPSSRFWR